MNTTTQFLPHGVQSPLSPIVGLVAIIHQHGLRRSGNQALHDINDGIESGYYVGIADQFRAALGQVSNVAGACAYADNHICSLLMGVFVHEKARKARKIVGYARSQAPAWECSLGSSSFLSCFAKQRLAWMQEVEQRRSGCRELRVLGSQAGAWEPA